MTDPVEIGDVVADKYVIQGVLGRGGVGVVYAAEHVTLRRRVALKFLRAELVDQPEVVQRFLREGRAAAQLHSEHVARVIDADTTARGAPYLVLELLEGRDLKTVLKEDGALPIETAVDYVLQACEAVAEAHAIGILHRDLKSDNLFVTRSPLGQPLVKVLDFGLSKIQTRGSEPGLTSDNHVMGSPHFMSPEQMRSSRDVDARSDLWALGVVLYTLIAGRVPFRGTYLTEVCSAVLSGDAEPLSAVRSEVPAGLEAAIARCLRLERADRFQSVSELATALAPFAGPGGAARTAKIAQLLAERGGIDSSTAVPVVADAIAPAAARASVAMPPIPPASSWRVGRRGAAAGFGLLVVVGAVALVARSRSNDETVVAGRVDSASAPPIETVIPPAPLAGIPADAGAANQAPVAVAPSVATTLARPAAAHPRVKPRRTPSDEDAILKAPH